MQNGAKDPAGPGAIFPSGGPARHRLDWGRSGLSARAQRVAHAVTEAMLSDDGEGGQLVPGSPAACARAVAWLDDALGRSSPDLRRGFAFISLVIDWLPLFVIGTPGRMSFLPLDRRVAYLEALEASRIGWLPMLLVAFKVPLSMAAFEDGAELASTGFDRPTTVARRKLAARATPATRASLPVQPTRATLGDGA